MNVVHVEGVKKGHIMLYALSTCVWCKKTKRLLDDMGVDHYYVDVDLLEGDEKRKIMEDIRRWNPSCSFPTLVIDNEKCVVGYKKEETKEVIGL